MCRRWPKAGASPLNASKFAHLRQRFAGDNQIDQDDLFDCQVNGYAFKRAGQFWAIFKHVRLKANLHDQGFSLRLK
jgi:hypothetical protein